MKHVRLFEAFVNESVSKDVYLLRDEGFDAKTRGNSILVSNLDIPGEKDNVIWWVPGRTPILPNYSKSYNAKCDTVEDLLDLLNNLKDTKGLWK